MALTTYPLNNIEYSAEDAELFHVTRTSGVYANNSFDYSVTGADNTIVIGTGIGWIKNSEFSGKVIALKDKISLDMGLPDSVYPRIDAIVIQFDANMNATNIVVKNGTASSEPIPPEISRDEAVYELHLYHVKREAGSLSITPSNITDLRLNSSYCGLMADSITSIDTYAIEKQVADLIKSLQNEISNVKDGSAYLLRDGSTGMTGNLQMDGNTITGLGAPVNDNDAVPKNYVMPAIESEAHPGCYYRTVDGVTEWINPPMAVGVVYRTTQRRNGNTVFTVLVDCGEFAHDKVVWVYDLWSAAVIGYRGNIGNWTLPNIYYTLDSDYTASVSINRSVKDVALRLMGGAGNVGAQTYVQIWFVQ